MMTSQKSLYDWTKLLYDYLMQSQCLLVNSLNMIEQNCYKSLNRQVSQPQLNSTVGFDKKKWLYTTHNHQHHHRELNVCNISAVIDPILTKLEI